MNVLNESIYKYMKIGLIFGMAFPGTVKDVGTIAENMKKVITDDYFNAIEISHVEDEKTRQSVNEMLNTSHMAVTYGAQPTLLGAGLNINDTDEEGRQKALALLKTGIDEAYEMGAEAFTFLSGKYDVNKKEEAYNLLVGSAKELCLYAKSKGNIHVILEAFDDVVDKKSLIGPSRLAKKIADEIYKEYDNFGLTVDMGHIPLIKETFEEAILPVKKYLMHVHIGNCVKKGSSFLGYGDTHPRFGFPNGENDVDQLVSFLKVLKNIGFLNKKKPAIVNFEVKPSVGEDPEIIIANSKRTLNMAWAKL